MTSEELRKIAVAVCDEWERRIDETIDNAAHVMQRAMQELNQLRRLRGVA